MEVIAWLLAGCLLFYSGFILRNAWFFSRMTCQKFPPDPLLPAVSVIIPARNESAGISRCLHGVCQQIYPSDRLEVILVDDHSTDGTAAIGEIMQKKHRNLSVIKLEGEKKGKKAAITEGVEQAKGEIILQIDGDCTVEPDWAKAMVSQFQGRTGVVAGPVALTYGETIFEKLQALESMGLVALAAGAIGAGSPNMANGANLAYVKKVFQEIKGFEGVDQVASGDDELLIQKIIKQGKYGIRYANCFEAIVRTQTTENWSQFRKQRIRWVSKARAYVNRKINIIQMISYLGFWVFPVMLIMGIWDSFFLLIALELFALKFVVDFFLMFRAAGFFHNFALLRYLPILQLVYIPYVIWIGIAGNFVKKYQWKDRWVT